MRSKRTSFVVLAALGLMAAAARGEATDLGAAFEISGTLNDMNQTVNRSGLTFQVALRQLAYGGRVTRTVLEQKDTGHVTLWMALRDVRLNVARTDIMGRIGNAACGPMGIVLGHRRDLWIAFDLEQQERDGQPRIVLKHIRFQLPPDNWSIQNPAWVQSQGLGMTQDRVVMGLREGLVNNRRRIEQELIKSAPGMLTQLAKMPDQRHVIDAVRSKLQTPDAPPAADQTASTAAVGYTSPTR